LVSIELQAEPRGRLERSMTDIVHEADPPATIHKVQLLMKAGLAAEQMVDLERGQRVTAVLNIFAAERGCAVYELVVVREGDDAPLTEVILVEGDYPHHRRHHIHHKSAVKVTVSYQTGSHEREFKRHETVEEVLIWAIKVFNIDPGMATEFELALHGQKVELPPSEHVGHVAGRPCDVALDLIRGHISNG
jgi:hypothetical protein